MERGCFRHVNERIEGYLRNRLPVDTRDPLEYALDRARVKRKPAEDRPLREKLFSRFSNVLTEPLITLSLLSVGIGQASTDLAEKWGKKSPIGSFMVQAPIKIQATSDLREFVQEKGTELSQGDEEARKQYELIASNYGIDSNSRIFRNPQLVQNLRSSFLLWGPYGESVKYIGIPAQAGLSALFLFQPDVNKFVSDNFAAINLGAVALTGGLMHWRVQQEKKAIEDVGFNPDFLQTSLTLLTSKRGENGRVVHETGKWVWIVDAVDMVKVSALYTLPVSWNSHLLTAALMTNVVDQVYHGTVNNVFRKMKLKARKSLG